MAFTVKQLMTASSVSGPIVRLQELANNMYNVLLMFSLVKNTEETPSSPDDVIKKSLCNLLCNKIVEIKIYKSSANSCRFNSERVGSRSCYLVQRYYTYSAAQ